MKCPYCEVEMEKGLYKAHLRFFGLIIKKVFFKPVEDLGDVSITPFSWSSSEAEAYLCNNCKKVIVNL